MWSTLVAFVLLAPKAFALLRFPCAQHTMTRSDPLVQPGSVSSHFHQVVGGNSFDFEMPEGMDLNQAATCSTCSITENKSNYWTPNLYFQSPKNGTFKRVRQLPGLYTGNPNEGMVVYYIQVPGQSQITAFPKGFRMLAGDVLYRSYNQSYDDHRSIMFRCLETDHTSGPDSYGMPKTKCAGGIRSQINFPTCWDGKNVDSPNHRSHVAYAIGASFGNFGQGCPSTHPVNLPLLFIETYWDTTPFDGEWSGNGDSPFVWSMGDPTGFGYHADYMMGWPQDLLQQVINQCTDQGGQVSSCSLLTSRPEQDMNDCAVPNRVEEDYGGWLQELPGCNPVQPGPGRANPPTDCGAPTQTLPKDGVSFLKSDIAGWTPVGCASENDGENLLNGARTTITGMTIEKCLDYCSSQGQTYAGIKNVNTCSCGGSIDNSKVSPTYACNRECDGDLTEFCGAVNRVAVYSAS